MMLLARCEGIAEQAEQGAMERFKTRRAQQYASAATASALRKRLGTIKEEIELLRSRLRRVQKALLRLDPVLSQYPRTVTFNGQQVPAGAQAACPGFVDNEERCAPVSPRKKRFELDDVHDWDEFGDEDEVGEEDPPEAPALSGWLDEKVQTIMLYGREVDWEQEESDDEDDAGVEFVRRLMQERQYIISSQPGWTPQGQIAQETLTHTIRQRDALNFLINDREALFKSYQIQLDIAEEKAALDRMNEHYCR